MPFISFSSIFASLYKALRAIWEEEKQFINSLHHIILHLNESNRFLIDYDQPASERENKLMTIKLGPDCVGARFGGLLLHLLPGGCLDNEVARCFARPWKWTLFNTDKSLIESSWTFVAVDLDVVSISRLWFGDWNINFMQNVSSDYYLGYIYSKNISSKNRRLWGSWRRTCINTSSG